MDVFSTIRRSTMNLLATGALVAAPTVALGAGVDPASVTKSLDPGASVTVTKTVTTPELPPKPDIVLVVDRTGSMGPAIANVKAEMGSLIDAIQAAQPDAEFAVVTYCDPNEVPFTLVQQLTASKTDAVNAVNSISLCDGGDVDEAQLTALWEIGSGGGKIAFRAGSTRAVAWFGDSSGHDPSNGHTLADATTSLTDVSARVVAINVASGYGNGLDHDGQATAITSATGGVFFPSVTPGQVANTILAGLSNLPAVVTANVSCDTGLSVSFDPALPQTVTSGGQVVLDETISVAADATQGATLKCTTTFLINGNPAGDEFVQTVTITVNDITPPTVSCGPGVNAAGREVPGYQGAGFYQVVAADNLPGVSVMVSDTASSATFGPYASGTYLKLTQAPGATPSAVAGTGAVDWHITLKGDAVLTATDAAGNTAAATCSVPPNE